MLDLLNIDESYDNFIKEAKYMHLEWKLQHFQVKFVKCFQITLSYYQESELGYNNTIKKGVISNRVDNVLEVSGTTVGLVPIFGKPISAVPHVIQFAKDTYEQGEHRNAVKTVMDKIHRAIPFHAISSFDEYIECILKDIAQELSIIYEYQILSLKERRDIQKAAQYAVSTMCHSLAAHANILFNKDDLITSFIKISKKTKFSTTEVETIFLKKHKIKSNWNLSSLFSKPQILLDQVKNSKDSIKYGFRGQFYLFDNFCVNAFYQNNENIQNNSIHARYPRRYILISTKDIELFLEQDIEKSLNTFIQKRYGYNNDIVSIYRGFNDLKNRNFSNKDLSNTDFAYTDFTGSSFDNANLQNAYFYKTKLIKVNLQKANLTNAVCDLSDCQEASLVDCISINTSFDFVNFIRAKGIDTISKFASLTGVILTSQNKEQSVLEVLRKSSADITKLLRKSQHLLVKQQSTLQINDETVKDHQVDNTINSTVLQKAISTTQKEIEKLQIIAEQLRKIEIEKEELQQPITLQSKNIVQRDKQVHDLQSSNIQEDQKHQDYTKKLEKELQKEKEDHNQIMIQHKQSQASIEELKTSSNNAANEIKEQYEIKLIQKDTEIAVKKASIDTASLVSTITLAGSGIITLIGIAIKLSPIANFIKLHPMVGTVLSLVGIGGASIAGIQKASTLINTKKKEEQDEKVVSYTNNLDQQQGLTEQSIS